MMTQIGIDVSKQKLDVAWLRDPETLKVKCRVFKNEASGFKELRDWLMTQTELPPESIGVMLEATGIYHEGVAYALYDAGFEVYVANPRHVSRFRDSLGKRSKTDKKDSIALARFLQSRAHESWLPEPLEVRHLKAIVNRLNAVDKDIQRERNRQEAAEIQQISQEVLVSIQTVIQALQDERKRLQQQIDDHFDRHPDLKRDRERLQTIPGIGQVLSMELTALLRSRNFSSASQVAAYLGLVPVMSESGTSVRGRPTLSKGGAGSLRAKLYMSGIVATRHNDFIKAQYQRLLARGKTKMSALGAAMRKLVQIAYGVLKHQQDYDPQWAN